MSAEAYTFATYNLNTFNAYEVAAGVIPEVAETLQVPLGPEPTSDDLQAIVSKVGTNKVLRANAEVTAIERDQMVEMLERGEIQQPLDRSFWTSDVTASQNADAVITMGGVANWQDRGLKVVEGLSVPVYAVAGNRVMDTATEKPNDNVAYMAEALGRYPTEAEYVGGTSEVQGVVVPRLRSLGREVVVHTMESGNGDALLEDLFENHPELLEQRLAVARVVNAGILMAAQVRAAARKFNADFDRDSSNPQLFVVTDTLPVARTDEQERNPQQFQKAATALRQMVLTAKKLHETQPED